MRDRIRGRLGRSVVEDREFREVASYAASQRARGAVGHRTTLARRKECGLAANFGRLPSFQGIVCRRLNVISVVIGVVTRSGRVEVRGNVQCALPQSGVQALRSSKLQMLFHTSAEGPCGCLWSLASFRNGLMTQVFRNEGLRDQRRCPGLI